MKAIELACVGHILWSYLDVVLVNDLRLGVRGLVQPRLGSCGLGWLVGTS